MAELKGLARQFVKSDLKDDIIQRARSIVDGLSGPDAECDLLLPKILSLSLALSRSISTNLINTLPSDGVRSPGSARCT
jgi:hypothetical protein